MHIEKRKQGKKIKYYLAYSFREKAKVRKIRRYLGENLSKSNLEKLKKRAEEILVQQIKSYKSIKSPMGHELAEHELEVLEILEAKGSIKIGHLSEKDWMRFTGFFTYDTNAIEGSTLKLDEVKDILEDNQWPIDALKSDISETYGVAEAIKYLRRTKESFSIKLINKLHKVVFENSKPFAGKLRKKGVEVVIKDGLGKIIHVGAPVSRIKNLLEELVKWYNSNKKRYHPLVLAVVVHNNFEMIHPYEDGNGRVGRLLLNHILLKHKMPPVNIGMENRQEYYKALEEYQNYRNIRPMIELIIKEYKILKHKFDG